MEDYRHRVFALERDNERLRQLLTHYQEEMLNRAQASDASDAGDAGALEFEMEGEEKGGEDGDGAGGDGIDEGAVAATLATPVSTGGGDSGEGKAGGRGGALKEKLAKAKFLAQEAAEAAAATPTPATITSSTTSTTSTSYTSSTSITSTTPMCCDSINAPPCARAEALQRQVDALQDELAMRQDEDDAEDNTDDTTDGEEDEENENEGGKGERGGEGRAMRRVRARSFGQAEAPTPRTGQQQLTTPQYKYTPRGKSDISNLLSISSTGAFMSRRLELVRPSLLLELKRLRRQNTVLRNQRGWRTSPSQLLRSRHHARRRVKLAQQLQDDGVDVDVDVDVANEGEGRVGVAREIQSAVAPQLASERNTREGGLGARRSILGGGSEPSSGEPSMGDGNDSDGDGDGNGGVDGDERGNDDGYGDGGGTTGGAEQTMVCVGIRGGNSVAELRDPRDVAMNQAWSHISPALHRERGGQLVAAPPPPPPPPPQQQQQRAGGALGKIFSLARVSWGSKGVHGNGGKDGGGKRSPRSSRRGHSRPSLFVRLAGSSTRRGGGGLLKGPRITIISPSLREAAEGVAGEARGMARPFTSSPLPPPLPPDNYSAGDGAGDESDAEQRLFEQQRQHLINYGVGGAVGGSPADAENIEPAVAGYLDDRPGHH